MVKSKYDEEGRRLPVKIDSTSNGEYHPLPLSRPNIEANALAHEKVEKHARYRGMSRRNFMVSACGAATTLLALNEAHARNGKPGGSFDIAGEAALDEELAASILNGKEFIFDVQGHYVNPDGAWLSTHDSGSRPFAWAEKAGCALADMEGDRSYLQCLSADEFVKDVFLDSDTDMMVLSFVPSLREAEPVTIEEAAATREIVENLEGTHRLMLHGRVNPNQEGDLEGMDELAERWDIVAWKTYTQWGRDGRGFFLHEEPGIRLIEKAIRLGIKNICVHKGLPFGRQSYEHSLCDDIGIVARQYPEVNFLVYHAGFVPGQKEGPWDPQRREGIDSLVSSLVENGIAPNSNVYPELGSTWRLCMQDPDTAAHTLGKLLKYGGEDNLLWGTDSIWYGSPQDQIQAFRSFQISEELQEKYGYPALTDELKAKVFGLNAIKPYQISIEEVKQRIGSDRVTINKQAYREQADPSFLTYGPKTRREFLNLRKNEAS